MDFYIFKTQHNFKIHFGASIVAVMLGLLFRISMLEWCIIVACIGCVMAAEAFNTALETITDLVSPDFHQLAKITKDTSAGAVLLSACMALTIGLIIFIPKLIEKIGNIY